MNNDYPPTDHPQTEPERGPSKTRLKKQSHELQSLGKELTELTRDQLARVELPENLREAIMTAHTITSHEARRRHMQFIGKLMRKADGDAIRESIGRATGDSRAAVALMHRAERWRTRLLDDEDALTELLRMIPGADAQWLRAAIRAARREHEKQLPPKHARELYRWLHETLPSAEEP